MNIFIQFTKSSEKERIAISDLLNFAERESCTTNIYKEFIVMKVINNENLLSFVCERIRDKEEITESLKTLCLGDINKIFDEYFSFNPIPLNGYKKTLKRQSNFQKYEDKIAVIVHSKTPEEFLVNLIDFYFEFGGGEKSGYISYCWENCKLCGISRNDKISYSDLYNIESQKLAIQNNTIDFIKGKCANNILLFGDSGTGKSSLVKATLNEYYTQKLRIIEIEKSQLNEIRNIINTVKDLNFKYIIFIDDLSFEENESQYKELKSVIDGKTEKQPSNILFYATSNRRHIIKESWNDRESDIHANDTKNETMSLSERFGIHISFFSLSKKEYLECVMRKCENLSLEYNTEVEENALKFALKFNGFSGRTAEQFVKSV